MFEYKMKCPMSHQVWMNRGGGWEKEEDNDMPGRDYLSDLQGRIIHNLSGMGDFGEMVSRYTADFVVGGYICVSDQPLKDGVEINIFCSRSLNDDELEELSDEISGQLSDGWGENISSYEMVRWSGRSTDYYMSVEFDVDGITKPEFVKEIATKPGAELATRFYREVLNEFESLSAIESWVGQEAVADMFYLQHALLVGGDGVEGKILSDRNAGIIQVIDKLPSRNDFMRFVVIDEPVTRMKF